MGDQSRRLELVNVLDESLKNRLNFFNNMDLLSKTVRSITLIMCVYLIRLGPLAYGADIPPQIFTGIICGGKDYSIKDLVEIARASLKKDGVSVEYEKVAVNFRIYPDDTTKFCSITFMYGVGKPAYTVDLDKKLVPGKYVKGTGLM